MRSHQELNASTWVHPRLRGAHMDWLDEGMASGFVLGAQWAADRAEQIEKEDT